MKPLWFAWTKAVGVFFRGKAEFAWLGLRILLGLLPLVAAAATETAEKSPLVPDSCLQYAEFRQEKTLPGLAKPLISRGKIIINCNEGTLWRTQWPIQEAIIYRLDGKQWIIKSSGEKEEVKNAVQKRVGSMISRIMRGDQAFIDKYFQREEQGEFIRLLPVQKRLKKYIESIELKKTPSDTQVLVKRVDGQNMRLNVSAVRHLSTLDLATCQSLLEEQAGCDLLLGQ